MIGQSAQRVVEAADQRPAEALRQNGISERLLVRAQAAFGCLQFQKQDASITDHHQIGKSSMHAHADQDRLTLCAARPGFGHLVGAMVDARAAAEVVLRAEGHQPVRQQNPLRPSRAEIDDDFDLIEDDNDTVIVAEAPVAAPTVPVLQTLRNAARAIGTTEITQGNIDNDHIYLRGFLDKFPADAIGGSNRASAAQREISVDWGGGTVVMTDLDGTKRFFRKRGWIREFFARHGARAGDMVTVEEVASYSYRVALQRRLS